ncbi:MAG TPA: M1 family metallopeptidase [Thermoanaerobaculia bacterium]|nr:M1 family metallopeptidase [Thermoanaerobaculia bacterium]
MRSAVAALFVTFVSAAPLFAQRLPQTVVPSHYRITLAPDLATQKFSGDETIDVDVRQPSTSIVLNAAEIDFDEVSITSAGKKQTAQVATNAQDETATLTVPDAVAGAASIAIRFRGTLNDKLHGFYLSRTPRRTYATTQFEATDARRAFPSFDEPSLKATFDISAIVDTGDTAISNGAIVSDTPGPGAGKHTIAFSQTRKLPTYLVALIVGDFQCSAGAAGDIPIRVCATPEKVQLTHFAVDAASKELTFLNDYYGIKYPFGKLDIIGVPDFAAGAMENAGAMTFREAALLVDDKTGSNAARERVASVIAHELAHQWFGDLVTMAWWDDVWLNEGFATWMAPKALAALNPQWGTPVDLAQSTARALDTDMRASTRAIRTHAETPSQIDALFDQIAYGKTAAVLRMAEAYVGADVFKSGIRAYLNRFAFGNASAEDFWGTMAATTKEPLDRIFSSYVLQAGEPVVSVDAKCENGQTRVTLSQRRFFANPQTLAAGSKEVWTIPIVARMLDGQNRVEHFLLDQKSQAYVISRCASALLVDANGLGYYRSEYASLPPQATLRDALTLPEKVSLLSDQWALVRAGEQKVGGYLALVESLVARHEPAIVASVIPSLEAASRELTTAEDRSAYRTFIRRLLSPVEQELGLTPRPGEAADAQELRVSVLAALGRFGDDPEVTRIARENALKILSGEWAGDRQVAAALLAIAARSGDAALYDQIRAKLDAAKSPEDYRMLVSALGSFTDPALVKRALDFALSPAVRSQDRAMFLAGLMLGEQSRPVVWPYVREHWPDIEKSLPSSFTMARATFAIAAVCTPAERDEVKAFLASHPAAGERASRAALERMNDCISFHELQAPDLATYLQETSK